MDELDRLEPVDPQELQLKQLDVEDFELLQKQRRSSMQARRTSLAECIPGWPLLQKRKAPEKVHTGIANTTNSGQSSQSQPHVPLFFSYICF